MRFVYNMSYKIIYLMLFSVVFYKFLKNENDSSVEMVKFYKQDTIKKIQNLKIYDLKKFKYFRIFDENFDKFVEESP